MYGGFWIDIHAPIYQVQGGAEIMYYGGDIAELLLAAALVATWRPEPRRRRTVKLSHTARPRHTPDIKRQTATALRIARSRVNKSHRRCCRFS